MKGLYRPRKEYKFWLCHNREEDTRLMDYIAYLKSTRQFAKVVRDGIRLIWSLREGNLSVLFELFPHLERQFNPDAEDLIAEFRQMMLTQRPAPPTNVTTLDTPAGEGGKKKLGSIKLDLPLVDDDDNDDTLVMNKSTKTVMTGQNLLNGVFGLGD